MWGRRGRRAKKKSKKRKRKNIFFHKQMFNPTLPKGKKNDILRHIKNGDFNVN